MIKVYTSGTFFEDQENPVEWQEHVLKETYEMGLHLVVEAQAHMCVREIRIPCPASSGMYSSYWARGLCDDAVLRFHVNKGFSTKTWRKAVEDLRSNGLRSQNIPNFQASIHE